LEIREAAVDDDERVARNVRGDAFHTGEALAVVSGVADREHRPDLQAHDDCHERRSDEPAHARARSEQRPECHPRRERQPGQHDRQISAHRPRLIARHTRARHEHERH